MAPAPSVERQAAAAPSPKSTVAMMSDFCSRSVRNDGVQASTTTRSTREPGRPCASCAAIDRPEAPPAQPSPKTGTRITSCRKPIRPQATASKVGVATPVEVTVTIASTSPAAQPASASAPSAASANIAAQPSCQMRLRSCQPWAPSSNHASGATERRRSIPACTKVESRRLNCGYFGPRMASARSCTRDCGRSWGASAVASPCRVTFIADPWSFRRIASATGCDMRFSAGASSHDGVRGSAAGSCA